ncbi:MAG: hypothetical protein GXP55_12255 [Deltaproteobacteria bacterium]|nr:hypothetical protein [Deltaproteobacteria bacterium]
MAALSLSVGCESCLKRKPVASVPRLAYPSCGAGELPAPELLASGVLRSGPEMREQGVVERYTLTQRGCLRIFSVRQEWPRQITDVEVVYDAEYRPLRAWKRMAVPGFEERTEDIRLYEFRGEHPTMIRRSPDGEESYRFEGGEPVALVGPGRALVGAWIRRARLEVGEVARGPVFDFRGLIERVEDGQLRRDADRDDHVLGAVRVFTFYGRETVFADSRGDVVGDLAGLLEASHVDSPLPPAIPSPTPPDPRGTP